MTSKSKGPRQLLLGTAVTDDDKVITGSRLPTSRQVLLCLLAHHADNTVTLREAANIPADTVRTFYEKARVATLSHHKMAEAIISLFDDMKEMLKRKNVKKTEAFTENLNQTMQLWPRNVMDRIASEEDRLFLVSMMGDRKASMAGVDSVLSLTAKKVHLRKSYEEKRKKKEQLRQESGEAQEDEVEEENKDEEEDEEPEHLALITPKRSHKRVVKIGSPAFWPHDVMRHPAVVESATRNEISGTQLSALTHSFVTATSGDQHKINRHAKTAYK